MQLLSPLFVFNHFGDLARCALRPGNVHSAEGCEGVLKPVVARYRGKVSRLYFRADAGFANPDVYDYLESERFNYAIRVPANRVLQERIGYLLSQPVGRRAPIIRQFPKRPQAGRGRAGSWPGRVASGRTLSARRLHHHQHGSPGRECRRLLQQAGHTRTMDQRGRGRDQWTPLSCRSFAANAVRFQLHALAYNLGNFLRTLATPEPIKDWSLASLKRS
jgi:Transposase DDE domain group 1